MGSKGPSRSDKGLHGSFQADGRAPLRHDGLFGPGPWCFKRTHVVFGGCKRHVAPPFGRLRGAMAMMPPPPPATASGDYAGILSTPKTLIENIGQFKSIPTQPKPFI